MSAWKYVDKMRDNSEASPFCLILDMLAVVATLQGALVLKFMLQLALKDRILQAKFNSKNLMRS